jgi:tetratricopeptide (TPR) repeat protein
MATQPDLRLSIADMGSFTEGLRALERGRYRQAADLFTAAITERDDPSNALSKRGVCHLRVGDRDAAERDFRAALVEDPGCLSAMVNLGNLLLEEGKLDDARLHYEAALRIDETYATAHHNLGVLLRRQGDIAASIRSLRLAAAYEAKPAAAKRKLNWWRRRR